MKSLFDSKKGNVLTIILAVAIIIIAVGWIINLSTRECSIDSDCSTGYYCGSDFTCHQHKTVQRTIANYNVAALILGISIIVAAIIFRWDKLRKVKMPKMQYYYEQDAPANYSEHIDPMEQEYKYHK